MSAGPMPSPATRQGVARPGGSEQSPSFPDPPTEARAGSAGMDRRWWSRAEGRRDPGGVGDAPQTSGRPVETAARRVVAGVRVPGLDVDAVNPDRRRAGEALGRRDFGTVS